MQGICPERPRSVPGTSLGNVTRGSRVCDGAGQVLGAVSGREILVDGGCTAAAFLDRPDDQALAAAGVAGREDARDARGVIRGLDIPARVALDAEAVEYRRLRADEAHGQ